MQVLDTSNVKVSHGMGAAMHCLNLHLYLYHKLYTFALLYLQCRNKKTKHTAILCLLALKDHSLLQPIS